MSANVRQISVDEARSFLESTRIGARTLLDVRQDFEYEEGHLPGAVHIPLPELSDRLGELDPAKPALVYCLSGGRSLAGANMLAGAGFADVLSMKGGMSAWEGAQAMGPRDLGLDSLLGAATPLEALARAWGMELALEGFYHALAGRAPDEEMKEIFTRLAGFEVRHRAAILNSARKQPGFADEASFETLARGGVQAGPPEGGPLEGGPLEGGVDAEEYLGLMSDPSDLGEALELAMAIEAQALDLYTRRAAQAEGVELRDTFRLLASEEKAHLQMLGKFVSRRRKF